MASRNKYLTFKVILLVCSFTVIVGFLLDYVVPAKGDERATRVFSFVAGFLSAALCVSAVSMQRSK